MGKRIFITLFKQLTVVFQSLIFGQQHQPHGTGSVEEAQLSPSPSYLTPAYITHAPFPTSTMCLDRDSPLCRSAPLQIPGGTDGAMVCHSSVCHMTLSLWLGGWREVTRGHFCHCWDTADTLSPMWAKSCFCLGWGISGALQEPAQEPFSCEKKDCMGDGRISQDEFHF